MLKVKRRLGESLTLFDTRTGERLLDIVYTGRTGDGIVAETVKPSGERHAFILERGQIVNVKDQIGRDLIVIQYCGRMNQAVFCIFGARNKITVLRSEILDKERDRNDTNGHHAETGGAPEHGSDVEP